MGTCSDVVLMGSEWPEGLSGACVATGLGPCVDERAALANALRPNAIVSIHGDGGPPIGRGFAVVRGRILGTKNWVVRDCCYRGLFLGDGQARREALTCPSGGDS